MSPCPDAIIRVSQIQRCTSTHIDALVRSFRKSVEKIRVCVENLTSITGTSREEVCRSAFTITCRRSLLRMRNVSDKIRREIENTYFMFNTFFLPQKSCHL
jgi:hypothetical protein